jgi:hypothetical protein
LIAGWLVTVAVSTALLAVPSCERMRPAGPFRAPTQIAFESARSGSLDVFVMNPDGSNEFNVTHSPLDETDPSFSPTAAGSHSRATAAATSRGRSRSSASTGAAAAA